MCGIFVWEGSNFELDVAKYFFQGSNFLKKDTVCLLLMSLPGPNFVKENTICLFDDVPTGGIFCKKPCFWYFKRLRKSETLFYLLGFEPCEYARTLSFEKSYPMD